MPSTPTRLDSPDLAGDEFTRSQDDLFTHLIDVVGDADTLWRLDTVPLPDEPFDWSGVDPVDVAFVQDVVALSDGCCDALLDTEFRTITRRILARVAARDPRPFRRRPHAARCAASLVWLAGEANGSFLGQWRSMSWLWAWFGVGNCSDRGRTLYRAAGLGAHRESRWLDPSAVGDPLLLHSELRARLLDQRDRMLDVAERRRTWSVSGIDGGFARVDVRADTTKVVAAVKAVLPDTGRRIVMVGFGDRVDDAYYVALSIPDADDLVRHVQLALDAPMPKFGASSE